MTCRSRSSFTAPHWAGNFDLRREEVFHSARKTGGLGAGVKFVIANRSTDRFFGLLLISLVVSVYLIMEEISRAMGKGGADAAFLRSSRRQPAVKIQVARYIESISRR